MKITSQQFFKVLGIFVFVFSISIGVVSTPCLSAQEPLMIRLQDHIPQKAIANAKWIGGLPSETNISLVFSLPLRNQQELNDLLKQIYDPNDPLYGQYLTPQEFADRFGPTQDDYDAVINYAMGLGFKITGTHPNRTLLDVSGSAATVNAAFGLTLQQYQTPNGRLFYAPDHNPQVPDFIASRIVGVFGLDNAAVWHAHNRFISATSYSKTSPYQIGTGPGGALTPGDIRKAYNFNGVSATGSGQTLGLFELDGYRSSDVAHYVSYYNLPSVPLQNVLVDGFSGRAGFGAAEVTLDIELQIALAPGASKIIVYEGPNSYTGVLDTYNRIATDNLAKQISTSWGLSEQQSLSAFIHSENAVFQQMAAQGQSIYAASGDSGAYDNGSSLSVDDPASQPYMVGVGGTQLFVQSDESYDHETTWNVNNTVDGGAGGGGVSLIWSIPNYQSGIASAASDLMRNVPDVSLNSDQYSGYSIYYKHNWYIFGGTSCAAPLWAAFTARVNQVRAANGTALGFANPTIYKIATDTKYETDFHDIADGSTNLYYVAGTGYDNATGWGSFNGANLLADLTGSSSTSTSPNAPSLAITGGPSAKAGKNSAVITWTTNLAANSIVNYGTSSSVLSSIESNGNQVTDHSVSLTSLSRHTVYYYQVSSTDGNATVSSGVASFRTH